MQHFGVKTNGRMRSEGQLRSVSIRTELSTYTIHPSTWVAACSTRANDTAYKCIHLDATPHRSQMLQTICKLSIKLARGSAFWIGSLIDHRTRIPARILPSFMRSALSAVRHRCQPLLPSGGKCVCWGLIIGVRSMECNGGPTPFGHHLTGTDPLAARLVRNLRAGTPLSQLAFRVILQLNFGYFWMSLGE
uniref:HDC07100 n=1 Tax=Drosophila melanogaster TaxID=7227 RepID=Q6IG75_DROME|nr:TPA_inf: HDC07100 [Drosophila melanogaster]